MGGEGFGLGDQRLPEFIVINYRASRRDVWSWYWSSWRRSDGLWRFWLILSLVVFVVVLWPRSLDHALTREDIIAASAWVSGMFLLFVVFPQLAYKPQTRALTVSRDRIETKIGSIHGRRKWEDISLIADHGSFIALVVGGGIPLGPWWIRTKNGNAFVVPNLAFATLEKRREFLHAVSAWHSAEKPKFPRFARTRYAK